MSRVYVAYDRRLGRRVAIKVLRPELALGVSLDRFRREIRTAASLQHPLIVPVLDTGEVDGLPYFTMPFVEGESLRARLSRGPLTVVETVRVLRDVARALAVAHSRGVVHRDIKPDNVLLADDAAVVADFGVAKAFADARFRDTAEAAIAATHTTEGVSLGTPAYMAPEQVAADPYASFPVDIYAVGVLAYEMLTGAPPFSGRSPQQVMAAHIAEVPVPVQQHRPEVPPALADLVMRCLEKDPVRRPASAAVLVDALEDPQVMSGSFTPIADDGTGAEALRVLTGEAPSLSGNGAVLSGTARRPIERRLEGQTGNGTRVRRLLAGLAALVVALLAWVTGSRSELSRVSTASSPAASPAIVPAPVTDTTPSVAILPFAFLGADSTQAYAADAITEAITSALSQERGLRVQSRAASVALQQRLASGDTARLPVRALVEGVVEVQGESVRLTVRLVNASDGFTLFADRIEGRRDDLFAMEDDVARGMRELLRAHFQLSPSGASITP